MTVYHIDFRRSKVNEQWFVKKIKESFFNVCSKELRIGDNSTVFYGTASINIDADSEIDAIQEAQKYCVKLNKEQPISYNEAMDMVYWDNAKMVRRSWKSNRYVEKMEKSQLNYWLVRNGKRTKYCPSHKDCVAMDWVRLAR